MSTISGLNWIEQMLLTQWYKVKTVTKSRKGRRYFTSLNLNLTLINALDFQIESRTTFFLETILKLNDKLPKGKSLAKPFSVKLISVLVFIFYRMMDGDGFGRQKYLQEQEFVIIEKTVFIVVALPSVFWHEFIRINGLHLDGIFTISVLALNFPRQVPD